TPTSTHANTLSPQSALTHHSNSNPTLALASKTSRPRSREGPVAALSAPHQSAPDPSARHHMSSPPNPHTIPAPDPAKEAAEAEAAAADAAAQKAKAERAERERLARERLRAEKERREK